jgi:hypothetical protein
MISRIAISYIVMLGAMLTAAYGSDNALVPLRQLYQRAQTALSVRDMQAFAKLKPQLIAYPLYPYLVFADLKSRLRSATDEEILVFARDQKWVRLWLRTHDHPERMLNEPDLRDDIPLTRKIVAFGIKQFVAIDTFNNQLLTVAG